jgi:hypothetical protein
VPDSNPASFVDPVLQEAVIRAWGQETAPPGLADRVRAAMAEAADAPLRLDARPGLRTWGALALAAVVLIAVGITSFHVLPSPDQPSASNASLAGGIPVSFVHNVISTHDHCQQKYLANHHAIGCDKNDYNAIKQALEQQLGHRVWVTPVASWEFRGAAECRTGDGSTRCAHLLYERPQRRQTLSIFSVPYDGPCSLASSETFGEIVENHPVAGFVDGKELYCLVGYAPDQSLTVDELKQTTQTYRQNLHALRIVHPSFPGTPTQLAHTAGR